MTEKDGEMLNTQKLVQKGLTRGGGFAIIITVVARTAGERRSRGDRRSLKTIQIERKRKGVDKKEQSDF